MRRRGDARQPNRNEEREPGERAYEGDHAGPRAAGENPTAERARKTRTRVVKEQVERARLRLRLLGA